MIRKTLTILSLIGLLLSVGLWGASFRGIAYNAQTGAFVSVNYGSLIIGNYGVPIPPDAAGWRGFGSGFTFYTPIWWPSAYRYSNPATGWEAWMPLWIPTVVFGLLFMSRRPLHFYRRRKRKKLGLCVKCGYDLRASKDRCPECGEGIEGVPKDSLKGSQNCSKSASRGDMR